MGERGLATDSGARGITKGTVRGQCLADVRGRECAWTSPRTLAHRVRGLLTQGGYLRNEGIEGCTVDFNDCSLIRSRRGRWHHCRDGSNIPPGREARLSSAATIHGLLLMHSEGGVFLGGDEDLGAVTDVGEEPAPDVFDDSLDTGFVPFSRGSLLTSSPPA